MKTILRRSVLVAVWCGLFANVAVAQTTIVADTFTGANGSLLTAHAPDTNPLNRSWTVAGSPAPALVSNRVGITSGSEYVTAIVDAGTPDVTVSTTFVAGANPAAYTNYAGLVFRRTDENNFFLFRRYSFGVHLFQCGERHVEPAGV